MTDAISNVQIKKRLQLGLLVFLILFHLAHLVLYEMVKTELIPMTQMGTKIILGIIALFLTILSICFLKYFIKSKALFIVYVILFAICIVFQFLTLGLDLQKDKGTTLHLLLIWAVGISVFIFFSILYITIRDIFTEKHDLTYALLGAANIFLSIIVTFAFIISLVLLSYPGLMPEAATVNDLNNVSFVISSYSVAGIDFPYGQIPQILKNITTFQSILMHLYAVMIVGRLLSR